MLFIFYFEVVTINPVYKIMLKEYIIAVCKQDFKSLSCYNIKDCSSTVNDYLCDYLGDRKKTRLRV